MAMPSSWSIDRLDFRAPGATQVALSGSNSQATPPDGLKAALDVEFVGSRMR